MKWKRPKNVVVGPPIVRCQLMYPDSDGVLRILRSAKDAITFGPASQGVSGLPIRFVFNRKLDPKYPVGGPIYPVLWKYHDNGLVVQIVGMEPIQIDQPFDDGWTVTLFMNVRLDKRQWVSA